MRRNSSTLRSDTATRLLIACLAVLGAARSADARPWPCLPPVYDGGRRLHPTPPLNVFWLELLFRQHEICWRSPRTSDELRIALIGNSAVYGLGVPATDTFSERLNRQFEAHGTHARIFNLGFSSPYQVRDAVVIHEALRYEPDVLLYPLSLADFVHRAPWGYGLFKGFFDTNRYLVTEMSDAGPPGLAEPFETYREVYAKQPFEKSFGPLRDVGMVLRIAARNHAETIAALVNSRPYHPPDPVPKPIRRWNCAGTVAQNAIEFRDWKRWNVLEYLESIQRTRNIDVLVVSWPVSHEPVGDCYNVRYGNAILADFVAWLEPESRRRGLRFLDLHDRLPPQAFLDSLHLAPGGHRFVANQLERALAPLLDEAARARRHSGRQSRRAPSD